MADSQDCGTRAGSGEAASVRPCQTLGAGSRPQKNVEIGVYYRVSLTVERAEQIVGRPWTAADDEDDSWTCELEEAVKDHLPDLLACAPDEPDVEWHG